MQRENTGAYETIFVRDDVGRAFIPAPLPPDPPLDLAALAVDLERAAAALGELNGLARRLPDPALFLYSYVRKEAVLSSRIEGMQSSISDLMQFETNELSGAPTDDVVEVSNYVRAMEYGLEQLGDEDGLPLSNRLIREIHRILLSSGRGSNKAPGEFRRGAVWIGGPRPSRAHFVPPPFEAVPQCMGDLEQFLHADTPGMPVLLRAGVAHLQFETIHPFLDGNGRVGRLLITFLLCHYRLLQQPLLYLSLFFKEYRQDYYDLLDIVRRTGDWEAWLSFFLDGVTYTANEATQTIQRLTELFEGDAARLQAAIRAPKTALQVHQALTARPISTLSEIAERTGLTFRTVAQLMQTLEQLGIAAELTGRQRNRIYGYREYLDILYAGTEPI